MDQEKVVEKLKEQAPTGKICCADARKLAENLKIPYAEIGKACDRAEIKIYGCELGCF